MDMSQYPELTAAEFSLWAASLGAGERRMAMYFMIGFIQHDLTDRQRGMLVRETEVFMEAWRATDPALLPAGGDSPLAP